LSLSFISEIGNSWLAGYEMTVAA